MVTIGFFDGVHLGHRLILSKVKQLANAANGEATVITLWPHPRFVLQKDPDKLKLLNTIDEKTKLLDDYGINNLIILPFTPKFASLTAEAFIYQTLVNQLHIHSLVVGYNHRFGSDGLHDFEALKKLAGSYRLNIYKTEKHTAEKLEISSSQIRKALLNGKIKKANQSLGYNYFFSGKIIEGNKLGRKIGFPTANIQLSEPVKLIPGEGVYAVRAILDNESYNGMMNIGYRPTVKELTDDKRIEVHLFDFDDAIYNKTIRVEVIQKTRNEKKFADVKELKVQLLADKKHITNLLNIG